MTFTENKHVLIFGLTAGRDPDPSKGFWSTDKVLEAVKHDIEEAKKGGFNVENYQIDLSEPQSATFEKIKALLRKRHWDGVSIGYGIRGAEDLTSLFEQLVNTVVDEVQPTPKFIFSLRPNRVWEAIRRGFGVENDQY